MDVILTHTHADFDGLGAMIGVKHLHPQAVIALPSELNANVEKFVALYREAFGMVDFATLDPVTIERVYLVDTQDPRRAGNVQALLDRADLKWEVFDHHPERPGFAFGGEVRPVGACTTLLVDHLRAKCAVLGAEEATAMLLGILEDTGRLRFQATTAEDAAAVAYLLEQGAQVAQVQEYLEPSLTAPQQALLSALLEVQERLAWDGEEILLFALDFAQPVEDQSLVIERLMSLFQPAALVAVIRTGQHTQLIARARSRGIDLLDLLAPYGAHGHASAVSGHDEKGLDPQQVLRGVRERLAAHPPQVLRARELMSHPVHTLTFEDTALGAQEALKRWGHTAMPVVLGDRVQGVVSRYDLDRAIHHGFGDRSIKGLVARRVEAVDPETPLARIREQMSHSETGRLLVMEQDRLLGIITRSDLIRVLERSEGGDDVPGRAEMALRLERLWPPEWLDLLRLIGRVAGETPVYLVGGGVRDLLLETPSFDVDLLVQGEAMALGKELAQLLGAKLKVHEPFGTAHLTLPDHRHVDLATARVEYYPHPGALPVVSPASVRQDLARRDFSVNALALRINPQGFGELLDFFGGVHDLHAGLVRVLHPVSFIEDPVRLFRAARFEDKLGFRMEPSTEAYARYAMESGRFDSMVSERLKLELRLDLGRSRVSRLARRLDDLRGWRMLHPTLRVSPEIKRALRRFDRILPMLPAESRWLLALALLLQELAWGPRETILEGLHLSRPERDSLVACWEAMALLARRGWDDLGDAELAHALGNIPDLALWAMALSTGRAAIRHRLLDYVTRLRHLKLERVNGAWLVSRGLKPGPHIGELLKELLGAKRSGRLETPEAEERMARIWLAERGLVVRDG